MSDWLTVQEVAAIYRCHEKTVRRMIRRGDLPARMIAGRWLVHRGNVQTRPIKLTRPRPQPTNEFTALAREILDRRQAEEATR